jgi:serine/threonine protein kinase
MAGQERSTWIRETYHKGKQIGTGAMGCAWLVQKKTGQVLVAKEINVQGMSTKDTAEAVQEAEVLRQLQHPNIISMYEAFVDGPSLYIIMEFADAGDLAQVNLDFISFHRHAACMII